jgi:hypothetical protein
MLSVGERVTIPVEVCPVSETANAKYNRKTTRESAREWEITASM